MQKLLDGLHHFQSTLFRPQQELFERLAHGQEPETLFITCSDSRIVPSLFTGTKPGDLFILRNAGNIVPPHGQPGGEAATIEYAVGALGVRDVIVCGHSACGAMNALLDPSSLEDLPAVRAWLSHAEATRRILRENYRDLTGEQLLITAVEENVLVQIENLRTHPAVAAALSRGRLRLHAWVYEIDSGEVFSYEPQKGQFTPVLEHRFQLPEQAPPRIRPGI